MNYPIVEIFHSLQGEGAFTGYPMTFVRLAGCSVRTCRIRKECDEAPWRATEWLTELEIAERVCRLQSVGRVCITGGEPTDHDLVPLIDALVDQVLHIETSGVRPVSTSFRWVTVSPKTSCISQVVANELKIVVHPDWADPWREIQRIECAVAHPEHYFLQPLYGTDGKPINLKQVIDLVCSTKNRRGWALSEQRHKTWGVR